MGGGAEAVTAESSPTAWRQEVPGIAEKWRPYRTLATFYLYSATSAAASQRKGTQQ